MIRREFLRRITADEVIAAYQKTGLRPIVKNYLTSDGLCGCPIMAIYVATVGMQPPTDDDQNARFSERCAKWACGQFGGEYVDGFVAGFDRPSTAVPYYSCAQGHADGIAVRKALEANGMLEVTA